MRDLTIIMPVYNEHEVVNGVILEWIKTLDNLGIDYIIISYNDGSTDNTLEELTKIDNDRLCVVNKINSGHGPTILEGYLYAESSWIFQVDSDNEISPDQFEKIWNSRNHKDFVIGKRVGRDFVVSRILVSLIARLSVILLYGRGIEDVNCPFRLFSRDVFISELKKIPNNAFAPNVILSGIAVNIKARIENVPVVFIPRSTGEVSIKKIKLLKQSARSLLQLVKFRLNNG